MNHYRIFGNETYEIVSGVAAETNLEAPSTLLFQPYIWDATFIKTKQLE